MYVLQGRADRRLRPIAGGVVGRGAAVTTAILLVEARGQSVHCREDACGNLVQAAWLARELVRGGVDVRMRLIADAGQSIEEYSILCHAKDEAGGFRERIVTAADQRAARYEVVRDMRARLPF